MLEGALILLAGIIIGVILRNLPARHQEPGPVEAVCVDNLELFLQLCLAALDNVVRAPARPGSPRLTH